MTATALHPRYESAWEPKPEDWSAEEWGVPEPWMHDFSERRWLTAEHRAGLASGTLDIPGMHRVEHAAVLVSIPDAAVGTQVAWIDKGLAEVVYLAAREGLRVVESCEGDPGDAPTLYFDSDAELRAFEAAAGPSRGQLDPQADPAWRRYIKHIIRKGRYHPAYIDPADLPGVVQRLGGAR